MGFVPLILLARMEKTMEDYKQIELGNTITKESLLRVLDLIKPVDLFSSGLTADDINSITDFKMGLRSLK